MSRIQKVEEALRRARRSRKKMKTNAKEQWERQALIIVTFTIRQEQRICLSKERKSGRSERARTMKCIYNLDATLGKKQGTIRCF